MFLCGWDRLSSLFSLVPTLPASAREAPHQPSLLPGFGGVKLFGSSTERRTGVWRVGVETSAQNAKFEKRKHVISIRTRNEDEGEGPCFLHLHALMF